MNEQVGATPEPIGRRLRRLRLERGLSQRELASPGVSYAYISRIEAGTRRPSVKALRMLARKLNISPEYLETGSEIRDVDARELRLTDAELKLRLSDEPGDAEATLARVLEESVQAGDPIGATRARVALGLAAAGQGNHEQAVERLEGAIASESITAATRPDVYATLGRAYVSLGHSRRAVELFEQCLAEVDDENPDYNAAYIRYATYLSYALADAGDLGRAESVVADALERADYTDPYTQVRLYWSMARLYEMEGRSAAALSYVRRAIALLEATEDTLHLAKAHLLCACIMNTGERAEDANTHLQLAEKLLGARAGRSDLALLRTEQAKAALLLGDRVAAVDRAREALEILGDAEDAQRGAAYSVLGDALGQQGEVPAAEEAFRRAADLLADQGRWRECAHAYRAWAKVLREAGREAEALDALEKATDFAVRSQPSATAPAER